MKTDDLIKASQFNFDVDITNVRWKRTDEHIHAQLIGTLSHMPPKLQLQQQQPNCPLKCVFFFSHIETFYSRCALIYTHRITHTHRYARACTHRNKWFSAILCVCMCSNERGMESYVCVYKILYTSGKWIRWRARETQYTLRYTQRAQWVFGLDWIGTHVLCVSVV